MGLLSSFTSASSAANTWPDLIEPVVRAREAGTTTSAVAGLASAVFLYRFRVSRPITVANTKVWIAGTAAGNIALGIYTSDGTTWTRIAATAETAASGANAIQTIALTNAVTLVPGVDYWAALGGDASTATLTLLRGASLVSGTLGALANNVLFKSGGYASGLPATITSPAGTSIPFWIGLTP